MTPPTAGGVNGDGFTAYDGCPRSPRCPVKAECVAAGDCIITAGRKAVMNQNAEAWTSRVTNIRRYATSARRASPADMLYLCDIIDKLEAANHDLQTERDLLRGKVEVRDHLIEDLRKDVYALQAHREDCPYCRTGTNPPPPRLVGFIPLCAACVETRAENPKHARPGRNLCEDCGGE